MDESEGIVVAVALRIRIWHEGLLKPIPTPISCMTRLLT